MFNELWFHPLSLLPLLAVNVDDVFLIKMQLFMNDKEINDSIKAHLVTFNNNFEDLKK